MPLKIPQKFKKCLVFFTKKNQKFNCVWGKAAAPPPPHPPPPLSLLFLYIFLCPPPLSFSSCIPLLLVIFLFCLVCFSVFLLSMCSVFLFLFLVCFDLTCDPSPSLSLCQCFFQFLSVVWFFSCLLPLPTLFLPSISGGGGAINRNATLAAGMFAKPLSLAPRPHPQTKLQECDERETQPGHPPRKSNKTWADEQDLQPCVEHGQTAVNPPKPQTRPKTPPISAPTTTTLGLQQSLKGELSPPVVSKIKTAWQIQNESNTIWVTSG